MFGQPQPQQTNLFGQPTNLFATPQPAGGTSLFGTAARPPQTNLFSTTPQPQQNLFGATQPLSTNLFGQPTATTSAAPGITPFGGFGTSTASNLFKPAPTTTNLFAPTTTTAQQPPQQLVAGIPTESLAKIVNSITSPSIYGDDRDAVVARFNQLQAFVGSGRGYFAPGQPPVSYNEENPFCHLKTVGYNQRMGYKNEDGCVGLLIKRSSDFCETNKQLIVDGLFKALGNKPQLSAVVDVIRPLPNDKCEVVVYVCEMGPSGSKRRILAADLAAYLNQQNIRAQITNELAVDSVSLKIDFTDQQLQQYLQVPAAGIDPAVWHQAQLHNPDVEKFIPVPIVGCQSLHQRLKMQQQQADLQKEMITALHARLEGLEAKIAKSQSRHDLYRNNQHQLSNRLLKVLAKHQLRCRQGCALDATEEALGSRLELLSATINGPNQSKSQLSEIISQIRSQPDVLSSGGKDQLVLSGDMADEIKIYLRRCQESLEKLVDLTNSDVKDLKTMTDYMSLTR